MSMHATEEWVKKQALLEDGCEVAAGTPTIHPLEADVADKHAENLRQESLVPILGRLVSLRRREVELTLEELSKRAGIDALELWKIEEGMIEALEPQTVFNLAQALNLPVNKLMQLAGLVQDSDNQLNQAAILFAARSGSIEKLTSEERQALSEFVKAMSS